MPTSGTPHAACAGEGGLHERDAQLPPHLRVVGGLRVLGGRWGRLLVCALWGVGFVLLVLLVLCAIFVCVCVFFQCVLFCYMCCFYNGILNGVVGDR